jgi:hypothetical protein
LCHHSESPYGAKSAIPIAVALWAPDITGLVRLRLVSIAITCTDPPSSNRRERFHLFISSITHCVQGRLHNRCAAPVRRGLQTWMLAYHADPPQSLRTSAGHPFLVSTPIWGPWDMRKASLIDRAISLRTHKSKHTAFLSKSVHTAKISCKLKNNEA